MRFQQGMGCPTPQTAPGSTNTTNTTNTSNTVMQAQSDRQWLVVLVLINAAMLLWMVSDGGKR